MNMIYIPLSRDRYEQIQITEENEFNRRVKARMDAINPEISRKFYALFAPRYAELQQTEPSPSPESIAEIVKNLPPDYWAWLQAEAQRITDEEYKAYRARLYQATERAQKEILRDEIRKELQAKK